METEWFDLLATLIRQLKNRIGLDLNAARTLPSIQLAWNGCRNDRPSLEDCHSEMNRLLQQKDNVPLLHLLRHVDQLAGNELDSNRRQLEVYLPGEHLTFRGLNSPKNQQETQLLLLPHMECLWEGASRRKNHETSLNEWLSCFFFVELKKGKLHGTHTVISHLLDTSYDVHADPRKARYLRIAISPISRHYGNRLKDIAIFNKPQSGQEKVTCFRVPDMPAAMEQNIIRDIKNAIQKAEQCQATILTFPEMLGSTRIYQEICEWLPKENLLYVKLIVLPSIWKSNKDSVNTNSCTVVNSEGKEIFRQDKLVPYFMKLEPGQNAVEDIIPSTELHLLHANGFGTLGVLICKSILEANVRDMYVRDLRTNLILAPAWSKDSYEFKRSAMAGAEWDCNFALCNTCSSLPNPRTAGIITAYSKNHERGDLNIQNMVFPKEKSCTHICGNGCIFYNDIYAI